MEYILDGGRLYVESEDWTSLEGTDLFDTLQLLVKSRTGPPPALIGNAPITEGMELGYNGSVGSMFQPTDETFSVWERGGNTYAVLCVDIDILNPANSYSVVASSIDYEDLYEMAGERPFNFTKRLVDFFLEGDDQRNNAPEIEITLPSPNPSPLLIKTLPVLEWENNDPDVWDRPYGVVKYSLFIGVDEEKVMEMHDDARSSVFIEMADSSTTVDPLDAPVSGVYYWAIFAEDKYGKTTYAHGRPIIYDIDHPSVNSLTALINGTLDDPMPIGNVRHFCPNAEHGLTGRPDGFKIDMSDNIGLRFSNYHSYMQKLRHDHYSLPEWVNQVEVFYHYEGEFEDDLPLFDFYRDKEGTHTNIDFLDGKDDVEFYIIPHGTIPDGKYHVYIQAVDMIRTGSYMDWEFEIDFIVPDKPGNFTISPETYVNESGQLFLLEGETYILSATAQSWDEFVNMNRVEFQQSATGDPDGEWETIGADTDVSDHNYSVLWVADSDYPFVRAVSFELDDDSGYSEIFSDFHVDGIGPDKPLSLQVTADLVNSPKATIKGYVSDGTLENQENQTSGVDYVILWHYDSVSETMTIVTLDDGGGRGSSRGGRYGGCGGGEEEFWGSNGMEGGRGDTIVDILKVQVIDNRFEYTLDLESISMDTGDMTYAFFVQAYDHVGNGGELSDMAVWTNTRLAEPIRVISTDLVKNVPMKISIENPDDSLDELRSITLTFTDTDQSTMHSILTMRKEPLWNPQDAASLGLPADARFIARYFSAGLLPTFSNYEAMLTIDFHISSRSQLGTKTSEILSNIRLISRENGDTKWRMEDLVGGQPQPIDVGRGLYRIQARVSSLGEYVIIVSRSDLTIPEVSISGDELKPGDETSISVTVHNGGNFPNEANNVKVKLFFIDQEGNQEYIGELDYGTINPEFSSYPDELSHTRGNAVATTFWTVPEYIGDDESLFGTILAQVDPDGYVREVSEINNERLVTIIILCPPSPPTLEISGPEGDSLQKDTIFFFGGVDDNIDVVDIQFRIDRDTTWESIEDYSSYTITDGSNHWHMYFDSEALADGPYTFKFRAYDGKHYSDIESVSINVDNSGRKEREPLDLPENIVFHSLLLALIGLFSVLGIVMRTPAEYFEKNRHFKEITSANGSWDDGSPLAPPLSPPPSSSINISECFFEYHNLSALWNENRFPTRSYSHQISLSKMRRRECVPWEAV